VPFFVGLMRLTKRAPIIYEQIAIWSSAYRKHGAAYDYAWVGREELNNETG